VYEIYKTLKTVTLDFRYQVDADARMKLSSKQPNNVLKNAYYIKPKMVVIPQRSLLQRTSESRR
jgi:hypothetical protein